MVEITGDFILVTGSMTIVSVLVGLSLIKAFGFRFKRREGIRTESERPFHEDEYNLYLNPEKYVQERFRKSRQYDQQDLKYKTPVELFIHGAYGAGSQPDRIACNIDAKADFMEYRELFKTAQKDKRLPKKLRELSKYLERESQETIQTREALIQLGRAYHFAQLGDEREANKSYRRFREWLDKNINIIYKKLSSRILTLQDQIEKIDPTMMYSGKTALEDLAKLRARPESRTVPEIFRALAETTYFLEESMLAELEKVEPGIVEKVEGTK